MANTDKTIYLSLKAVIKLLNKTTFSWRTKSLHFSHYKITALQQIRGKATLKHKRYR